MNNKTEKTLKDLNDYLLGILDELSDDSLSGDRLDDVVKKAKAASLIGTAIVTNADEILSIDKYMIDKKFCAGNILQWLTGKLPEWTK